jgi:hypothetical protein
VKINFPGLLPREGCLTLDLSTVLFLMIVPFSLGSVFGEIRSSWEIFLLGQLL